jgi:hypothetical protein
MVFAILGVVVAVLEIYTLLFRPDSFASVNPITIGLPIVIGAGAFRRPVAERAPVLVFAAMLAVSLNRMLIVPQVLVHILVFGGALYLGWWGYRVALRRRELKRLGVAVCVTVAGFLLIWAWQLM